jgi:hypothetical protein
MSEYAEDVTDLRETQRIIAKLRHELARLREVVGVVDGENLERISTLYQHMSCRFFVDLGLLECERVKRRSL